MPRIEFWKMSGSGNDFILIDNRDGKIASDAVGRLVQRVCRRRESVGADGVILVTASASCDFGWHYLNADGGEVEMCGNGTRCVARFAHLKGIAGGEMTFETLAGPVSAVVQGRVVKVLMPDPSDLELDIDLPLKTGWQAVDSVNTGVPHVVVQVEELAQHPVVEQGRALRYDPLFAPAGTNANFIRVTGPQAIEMRTYERGVEDETLACGTGAIASTLVCAARGLVVSPVSVKTQGGETLRIHFAGEPERYRKIWLEGGTSIVYQARLHEEAL